MAPVGQHQVANFFFPNGACAPVLLAVSDCDVSSFMKTFWMWFLSFEQTLPEVCSEQDELDFLMEALIIRYETQPARLQRLEAKHPQATALITAESSAVAAFQLLSSPK